LLRWPAPCLCSGSRTTRVAPSSTCTSAPAAAAPPAPPPARPTSSAMAPFTESRGEGRWTRRGCRLRGSVAEPALLTLPALVRLAVGDHTEGSSRDGGASCARGPSSDRDAWGREGCRERGKGGWEEIASRKRSTYLVAWRSFWLARWTEEEDSEAVGMPFLLFFPFLASPTHLVGLLELLLYIVHSILCTNYITT
jgi:hypothetical protein